MFARSYDRTVGTRTLWNDSITTAQVNMIFVAFKWDDRADTKERDPDECLLHRARL